jgi:hypothetical protein
MVEFRSKFFKETDDIFSIIESAILREQRAMQRLVDAVRGGVSCHLASGYGFPLAAQGRTPRAVPRVCRFESYTPPLRSGSPLVMSQEVLRAEKLEEDIYEAIQKEEEDRLAACDEISSPSLLAETKKITELRILECVGQTLLRGAIISLIITGAVYNSSLV